MKRSVAILGPTPQFVRWAILHPCSLRQLEPNNLADSTFRQLRGLRELSTGYLEERVVDGICVHPDASSRFPAQSLGFLATEVLDAFGDAAFVNTCCQTCPANVDAHDRPGSWAGCYGWLPASDDFVMGAGSQIRSRPGRSPDSQPAMEANKSGETLVEMLDGVIESAGWSEKAGGLFLETSPRWYGIWETGYLTRDQIEFLRVMFEQILGNRSPQQQKAGRPISELVRFYDALRACSDDSLELFVELIPPGYSDGLTWTQLAHCPTCKCVMNTANDSTTTCPACSRTGSPHGERKGKVLGLRPYVRLCGVIGERRTEEFLKKFESQTS